jgi:hypothetical protein
MTTVEIFFKESEFSELEICIDNSPVEYTIQDNVISIKKNIDFGVHQLSISMVQGNCLDIADVVIDGASLRMLIYMSYLEQENDRIQPATKIWKKDQIWQLPFGNPVSFWLSLVYEKISNGEFGQNLFDKYYLYYPDTMELDHTFPLVVRSFFKHNFDFVCVDKSTPVSQLPYHPVELLINHEKKSRALDEIIAARKWIEQHKQHTPQSQYNSDEFDMDPSKEWVRLYLIRNNEIIVNSKQFPALYDLLDSMGITDIKMLFIGILPPGGYIAPHKDRQTPKSQSNDSDYNLYIPMAWQAGNYFKFNGGGIIKDGRPFLINNMDYVHSLVNTSTSDQDRIVIGIKLSIEKNPNLIIHV